MPADRANHPVRRRWRRSGDDWTAAERSGGSWTGAHRGLAVRPRRAVALSGSYSLVM